MASVHPRWAPWRDLPQKWMTVYRRLRRWTEASIWEAVRHDSCPGGGRQLPSLDSTTVRGHVSAASAKGRLANNLSAAGRVHLARFIVSAMPDARASRSSSTFAPGEATD